MTNQSTQFFIIKQHKFCLDKIGSESHEKIIGLINSFFKDRNYELIESSPNILTFSKKVNVKKKSILMTISVEITLKDKKTTAIHWKSTITESAYTNIVEQIVKDDGIVHLGHFLADVFICLVWEEKIE